jgi:type I restriction enzyme R subunit
MTTPHLISIGDKAEAIA